jgi:hypothetical protein
MALKSPLLFAALTLIVTTIAVADTAPERSVSVSPALLERYASTYRYSESAVVHVTRHDDHLSVRFTGEATAQPLYPRSTSTFFYGGVGSDALIEFTANGGAVLRQNGAETRMPRIDASRAADIEAQVSQRAAAETANPLSEDALRHFMNDILAGRIDSKRLCPQLVGALGKDLPEFQQRLTKLGKPLSVRLEEVGERGNDEYEVVHEQGVSQWGLVVDPDGVITSATLNF